MDHNPLVTCQKLITIGSGHGTQRHCQWDRCIYFAADKNVDCWRYFWQT